MRRSLVVLAAVLTLVAAALTVRELSASQQAPSAAPSSSTSVLDGQPGVGDPYFPDYGSSGYDAVRYAISVSWDPGEQSLTGHTVISARATQELRSFWFDLALTTESVSVNGTPATFSTSRFQDVRVTPASPITDGADFEVVVDYAGAPALLKEEGTSAWRGTKDDWIITGEPESSAWWYPSDDHPSDPALMDVSVRVPAGVEALSNGRLESKDSGSERDYDTWHWSSPEPMATYLSFLAVGQYELREGGAGVRPSVYAVSEQLSPPGRKKAFSRLLQSEQVVSTLETMFGPYPFSDLGGVVPGMKLPFTGLETQTRPVYARNAILDDANSSLLPHELTHMWFGDRVTVRQWRDIFLNEGYATWAEWGYAERTGGGDANTKMNALFNQYIDDDDFWRITMVDPGRDHLFDAVYSRGPMVLQALRDVIGDDAFFALAQDWSRRAGSGSTQEWMAVAQSKTTVDLGPFFQAWMYSPTRPERSDANGFRN